MINPRHDEESLEEHESLIRGYDNIASFLIPELAFRRYAPAALLMRPSGFCIESFLDTLVPLIGSFLRVRSDKIRRIFRNPDKLEWIWVPTKRSVLNPNEILSPIVRS
jgi:hypothetical protein